jgi:hypothetical protein
VSDNALIKMAASKASIRKVCSHHKGHNDETVSKVHRKHSWGTMKVAASKASIRKAISHHKGYNDETVSKIHRKHSWGIM